LAAGLSAKDNARARQARKLYKEGQYEEAAKVFSNLSLDYPDKLVFTRNLGACYYYLRRPDPALSNLREYLQRSQDITPQDRREVEGWIAEMETLRSQAAPTPTAVPGAPAVLPVKENPAPAPAERRALLPNPPAAPMPSPVEGTTGLTSVPAERQQAANDRPLYKKWWLWTGIGAALAAGTVTAIILATRSANGPCAGTNPNCFEVK
jgi:tetratricopeptide (TPR) repeat protein